MAYTAEPEAGVVTGSAEQHLDQLHHSPPSDLREMERRF